MKQGRMILIAITLATACCRESDEGRLTDDDTIPVPAPAADSQIRPGPGPGLHGMGHGAMMSGMNRRMVEGLGAKDSAYDKRFIDMMIPHHKGCVDMARDAETKAVHSELKDLARNIAASQEKEIARMSDWRRSWYGE